MTNNKVLVSICCGTYNHEKYIKEALDSFVNQKTNFKYEVIVVDDASTDGTAKIIKQYQKKYPDLIRAVFNKENQFSKGNRIFGKMFSLSKGKYISYCDGDDYFIDSYKLQKQVDFMEENPEYGLVATNYKTYNDITGKLKNITLISGDYSVSDLIMGDGGLFATSSTFLRKSSVKKLEKFYFMTPFEDYVSLLNLALTSKIYLLSDYTCVYRINATNSITTKVKSGDVVKKRLFLLNEAKKMYAAFNKCTNNKYKDYTDYILLKNEFIIHVINHDIKKIKDKKFKKLYRFGSFKNRVSYFIKIYFCRLYIFFRKLKHKIEKY